MQIVPYLNFDGNAKEAFDFYAKALNGRITAQMAYREGPKEWCDQMPPETLDRIMHTQLESAGAMLMGADGPPSTGDGGNALCINVMVDSVGEAERIFAALAEGGTVHVPIAETFWAHRWGTLADRNGMAWMVQSMKQPG